MAKIRTLPRKHAGKKTTENQEKYDKTPKEAIMTKQEEESAAKADQEEKPQKKRLLTIAETKLGVTLVIDHHDLEAMGYKDTMFTGPVIESVRKKLGLQSRKERKERAGE